MPDLYELEFKPTAPELEKCYLIIQECKKTLQSLLSIHNEIADPTEREDLLRAMFVFATAGLDSLIKQGIKDALSNLIEVSEGANLSFKSFVETEIKDNKQREPKIDSKLLAELLTSRNPRENLKARLVYYLTSNSLQSKDQILQVSSFFDIASDELVKDKDYKGLSEIFIERNKIIHEMDIKFEGDRSRNEREIEATINNINVLLELGEQFIKEVDAKLTPKE